MDIAVDEFRLHDMEEASTTVADDEPPIERSLPPTKRTSKVLSDSESHKEPRCRYPTPSLTSVQSLGATATSFDIWAPPQNSTSVKTVGKRPRTGQRILPDSPELPYLLLV